MTHEIVSSTNPIGSRAHGWGSVLPIVRRRRDAESLHLVKQRGALQSESRGCSPRTSELPIGALTRGENLLTDSVLQRGVGNLDRCWFAFLGRCRFEDPVIGKDYAACNVVLQLRNVPGPRMTNQGSHGFLGDGLDGFVHGGRELFDEVPHELRNVSFPFAERWQGDRENIQPVVQIFAEFTVSDHLPQVLVGRRDDANIDPRGTRASYGLELALLEHTEQLGLKLQRQVSDFIEKQRATIRQCKAADGRSESAPRSSPFLSAQ